MKRPLLSRLLPNRWKQSLYYRLYRTRHTDWPHLFDRASLALAPDVAMHGLVHGDEISGNIAFHGFYELPLSERMVELARKGGVLVDVGANMGYFSLLWAGANPAGRVFAFEASPRNIAILQNNVSRNRLGDRVTVIPKATGDHAGTVTFDTGPSEQTGWGGIATAASAGTIEVPLVRLDEELPDVDIDVLKVDVEGADTWVLFGCEALLRKKRIGTIFFEQNLSRMSQLGIQPGKAQQFLRDLGYECVATDSDEGEWMACPKAANLGGN